MGGAWGAIATGIFATVAVNSAGSGLIDAIMGLRVGEEEDKGDDE